MKFFIALFLTAFCSMAATPRGLRVNYDSTGTNTIGVSVTVDSSGTNLLTGSTVVSNVTASLPAKFDANKKLQSGAIDLSGVEASGIIAAARLADTAVTPGTYGDATHVSQVTVDQKGHVTSASNVLISGAGGTSVLINGTSVSNPNFTNSSTATFTTSNVTNITANPTNIANAQVATAAAIAFSKIDGTGRTISTGAGLSGGGDLSANRTLSLDATTYVNNIVWWDGSQASRTWTFSLSGATDPAWTIGNNSMDLTTGVLKQGGNLVADSTKNLSFFATTTSSQFFSVISDESGSSGVVPKFNLTGIAQGDVIYFNGTDWVNLGHGTSGQLLQTGGVGANPSWATVSGAGDVTAAAAFGTNALFVVSDGTGKGVKSIGGATLDSSGNASFAGSVSSGVGSTAAGGFVMKEGTAPSLVANSAVLYAPADVDAGGIALVAPASAFTGILKLVNSSGVMSLTQAGSSDYVSPSLTLTAGAGLTGGGDLSANRTFTLDQSTFVNNITMWDASQSTRTWTANLSGATDPVWTYGNNSADLTTGVLKYGGNTVATSVNNLSFFSATTSAQLAGIISDETGSGPAVFGTSPTITTPTISGAISFPDGVRQTFNPDGTTPGLNVGAQSGDPSTPSNGDIWYDSTGQLLRGRINGANVTLNGSVTINDQGGPIYVTTADATVSNTGTETTLFGSGTGSKTLSANYLTVSKNVHVIVRGRMGTKALTPGTLTIKFKLGSVVIWSAAISPVASLANDYFEFIGDLVCRTTGASGTVFAQANVLFNDGVTTAVNAPDGANTSTSTIDTTATQVVDVTATWGTADTLNTITGSIGVIEDGTGGTVTATGGSLTANAIVLGAGGTDTKVVAGITTDGVNKITATTFDLGNTDTTIARASAGDISVEGNLVYRAGGTDVPVTDGGTGLSAGTSGGVPYFSGSTTIASSAALAANAIVVGGGAGAAPATVTTGTGVLTALGNAVNTAGGVSPIDGTATLSNKRISARITTITSSATPTVNTDNADCVTITAQAAAITSMTTNLSGTPNNFDQVEFRIKDDGTARAITWGASFVSGPATLPTTTTVNKALHVYFEWDAVQSKWVCMSTGSDA